MITNEPNDEQQDYTDFNNNFNNYILQKYVYSQLKSEPKKEIKNSNKCGCGTILFIIIVFILLIILFM